MRPEDADAVADALMHRAAMGDRESLRLMATACIGSQLTGIPSFEALVGAEAFARLMSCHGNPDDQFLLASVLYLRSQHLAAIDAERTSSLRCEALAIIHDTPTRDGASGLEWLVATLSEGADSGDDNALFLLDELWKRTSKRKANELRVAVNAVFGPEAEKEPAR